MDHFNFHLNMRANMVSDNYEKVSPKQSGQLKAIFHTYAGLVILQQRVPGLTVTSVASWRVHTAVLARPQCAFVDVYTK